ncbi:iron-sulfur cluster insertion protein ErpA [Oleiphilus sp. HI0071]|jgi:iron-sulfur cluster insertion protein|uniref:iron-sulfur cluster insertion protein ErpA n=1 Tax=unclassified Oleiphilus TaxID=2631174 RepID=UPI0007C26854|nr:MULTISPECIES: iron-sulfur cluster insertion protein ErpA [unclassified Oleiphilus]KZY68042.1 iron-sulfur cluster insertion protein ErpA [Oleiphilus sp. HI0065]KZY89834.1 iron-sulfur cluster insertion protein ErpA [Oleiphilus sp. HI0071]KZY97217.1 iron-sulfur cluster insertion protein ErpA [Oleiphilus sp. HI0073]KZZ41429.1 iron-sulfur cluster insertion protein ErpA [Oleiphilus sp. HI0118]KZZ51628.1 iron-sulfur cluster insertion protein ErpA [Oleiphilus sp. HI0122]KZZ66929.1 iron-sulfur clus
MSVVQSHIPSPLIFTDAAATKVKNLIEEEENPALKLRVYVTGGGCSGFQYGFSFDEELADDDTVIENMGVNLVVDPMSYQYLVGSTVDYSEGLKGAQFVINNPNATTTCGCGSSFTI